MKHGVNLTPSYDTTNLARQKAIQVPPSDENRQGPSNSSCSERLITSLREASVILTTSDEPQRELDKILLFNK
jgi:hypothetical protein